jgi:hypothetical protein
MKKERKKIMKKLYIQPEVTSQKTQCTFSLCDGIFSIHGNGPGFGGEDSAIDPG